MAREMTPSSRNEKSIEKEAPYSETLAPSLNKETVYPLENEENYIPLRQRNLPASFWKEPNTSRPGNVVPPNWRDDSGFEFGAMSREEFLLAIAREREKRRALQHRMMIESQLNKSNNLNGFNELDYCSQCPQCHDAWLRFNSNYSRSNCRPLRLVKFRFHPYFC